MKPMAVAASVSGIVGFSGQSLAAWTYYNEPDGPAPLGPANLTFLDESSIRHFKGGVCVTNYLDAREREILEKGPTIDYGVWQNLKSENAFAKATGKADGCVAISWIKETWKSKFFRTKIRYEWIFTVGEESLVVFGLFNPEDKFHQITWKTTYIKRNADNFAWLVRYGDKKDAPKKPDKADEYWGYNPNSISNFGLLCKYSTSCVDDPLTKSTGEVKWTWEEDKEGEKKFTDWTKNFWATFGHLNEFNNLGGFIGLVNSRTGTWTKR